MTKLHNILILTCLLVTIPTLYGNILEDEEYWGKQAASFDEYWKKKEATAEKENERAYINDPFSFSGNVTDNITDLIISDEKAESNGRRNLAGKLANKRCMATNPIDRCWRCDKEWAKNRKKLADCVQGFGRNTVGGQKGSFYEVTSNLDDDMVNPAPGTLRHAVTRTAPLWIYFSRSMTIRLSEELIVASDKTIDGRGADIYIMNGAGFTLQFVKNVIIHGIKIFDINSGSGGLIRDSENHYGQRTQSDGDGISIFGSSHVWIDHVSMRNCKDGLIDAIMGSTAITISNCHFTDHNEVMLFGASDSYDGDKIMQITLLFNHFGKRLIQRMPRCRYGFFHVVNNDYTHWEMYAIGGSKHPTIISEGNRFTAPDDNNAKEVTKRTYATEQEWKNWQWRSIKDELVNGAYFRQSGPVLNNRPFTKKDMVSSRPGSYVVRLSRYAGALRCVEGNPC
ncbi:pectate lyase [Vigna radiata var. radiata]|uniref:Pectate lyase n=1 Tax=Vigna radiata var. radiata TaxID=3916 RepID=A0A1S3VP94_VIGRR|nr:pectate lyase [Vigna radiata var. radiata]